METKNTFSDCDKCGKDIQYKECHISINKNLELAEYSNSRNRIEIKVADALQLLTLCQQCGEAFDTHFTKLKADFISAITQNTLK